MRLLCSISGMHYRALQAGATAGVTDAFKYLVGQKIHSSHDDRDGGIFRNHINDYILIYCKKNLPQQLSYRNRKGSCFFIIISNPT